jgi:Uma2 family endonuclease
MITPLSSTPILETEITHAAFLAGYEGMRVEWVQSADGDSPQGMVIEMPSIDERHDALVGFLRPLFDVYLSLTGGGRVLGDPMLMRLPGIASRAPDLQVLLPGSLPKLQQNEVVGAADVVVEIVSAGSQRIDRIDKFTEYERGGVPEYWLLDPIYREALFYQRDAHGLFARVAPDEQGIYTSRVLPRLRLLTALLWQSPLPNVVETVDLVRAMLSE